jgi:hypothetical protein
MRSYKSTRGRMFLVVLIVVAVQTLTGCGSSFSPSPAPVPVAPVANACSRPPVGSIVQNPPALFSEGGALNVKLSYQTTTDSEGRTLFCFMTPNGSEGPTLNVNPGDHLVIRVTNNTPAKPVVMQVNPPNCGQPSSLPNPLLVVSRLPDLFAI